MPSDRVKTNRTARGPADRFDGDANAPAMRLVDLSLAGCLLLTPFLMAGRHPFGQAVLIALCLIAAVAWTLGQAASRRAPFWATRLAPILLLGTALVALQVVPLPEVILDKISPRLGPLLPLWDSHLDSSARLGTWRTISLTPAATRDGLMLLSAYVLLFLVTVQRARRVEDVERLLRWCAATAAITAVYGLVQLLTSNGKFFWFYEHPYTGTLGLAKANFTNRNHFAHFLALGLGPLLWCVQAAFGGERAARSAPQAGFAAGRKPHELKAYFLAVTVGLVLFAGLLSLSRGGMIAMGVATGLTTVLCWRTWSGNKHVVALLAGAGILVALLLNVFGLERVSNRFDDLQSCSVERLDRSRGRRSVWTSAVRTISEFPVLGTGVGSHGETYPIHYSNDLWQAETEFTHAESSYLQAGVETGLAGLSLLVAAVVCCGFWCASGLLRAQSPRIVACLGAITGSLAATAVHAATDFVWYAPACTAVIVILAACAARLWRQASIHGSHVPTTKTAGQGDPAKVAPPGWLVPRYAYLAAGAILVLAGTWVLKSQVRAALAEPAWDAYRLSRMAMDKELERSPSTAGTALPASGREAEERRIHLLQTVLRWQPDHARAHLDLAECYLRLFDTIQAGSDNPMSLGNVRDAAIQSRFPSRKALDDWLGRAVGEHARFLDRALGHVRRALALSPLQGRGYLYLAELCFLENGGDDWKKEFVQQALRVRPYDGEVLDAAAREALLSGDHEGWLELARRSFQTGRRSQRRLITDLVGRCPTEVLEETIRAAVREFKPDLVSLRFLLAAARQRGQPEPLSWIQRRCAEQAEADAGASRGEAAARLWNEARNLYGTIGENDRARQCAQNAAKSDPQNFEARYWLAMSLMEEGRPAEAEPHFQWCLRRRPNDSSVEARWKEAAKGRLDRSRETAIRPSGQRHPF